MEFRSTARSRAVVRLREGGCLSLGALCGRRSIYQDDRDTLLPIVPTELLETILQGELGPALVWLEDSCFERRSCIPNLSYRLCGVYKTCALLKTPKKIKLCRPATRTYAAQLFLSEEKHQIVTRTATHLLPILKAVCADVDDLTTNGDVSVDFVGPLAFTLRRGSQAVRLRIRPELGLIEGALSRDGKSSTAWRPITRVSDIFVDTLTVFPSPAPCKASASTPEYCINAAPNAYAGVRAACVPLVADLSHPQHNRQRRALHQLLTELEGDAEQSTPDWVSAGVLEALVVAAAADQLPADQPAGDGVLNDFRLGAAMLILSAKDAAIASAAATKMVEAIQIVLARPAVPSTALLDLTVAVLDDPNVLKVAMLRGLGDLLVARVRDACGMQDDLPQLGRASPQRGPGGVALASPCLTPRTPGSPARTPGRLRFRETGVSGLSTPGRDPTTSLPSLQFQPTPPARPVDRADSVSGASTSSGRAPSPSVPKLALDKLPTSNAPSMGRVARRMQIQLRGMATPDLSSLASYGSTPPHSSRGMGDAVVPASEGAATLGSALGLSVVAADLAACISHKRRAATLQCSSASSCVGDDAHRQPPMLEAHRIILTHRSIASSLSPRTPLPADMIGSMHLRLSHVHTETAAGPLVPFRRASLQQCRLALDITASTGPAGAVGAGSRDPGLLSQSLLLRGLLVLAPIVSDVGAIRSPADIMLRLLLAETSNKHLMVSGLGFRHLCLAVLQAFAGHLGDSRQVLMLAPAGQGPPMVEDVPRGDGHLLPRRTAVLLSDCLTHAGVKDAEKCGRARVLVDLLRDYLAISGSPSLPALIQRSCGPSLRRLLLALERGQGRDAGAGQGFLQGAHTWAPGPVDLLCSLASLYASLLKRCKVPEVGRELLGVLCEDEEVVLLLETAARVALPAEASAVWASARVPLLDLYTALALLAARQPSVQVGPGLELTARQSVLKPAAPKLAGSDLITHADSGGRGRGGSVGLTRAAVSRQLKFLAQPPHGLAIQLVQEGMGPAPVMEGALRLIAAAASVPGSNLTRTQAMADRLLRLHYVAFTNTYAGQKSRDIPPPSTCKLHLEVLRALAAAGQPEVRRSFAQLHVLDFLVHEMGLEHEVVQHAHLPAAMLDSLGGSSASSTAAFRGSCTSPVPPLALGPAPCTPSRGASGLRPSSSASPGFGGAAPGTPYTTARTSIPASPSCAPASAQRVPRLTLGVAPGRTETRAAVPKLALSLQDMKGTADTGRMSGRPPPGPSARLHSGGSHVTPRSPGSARLAWATPSAAPRVPALAGRLPTRSGIDSLPDDSQATARSEESVEENPNTVAKLFPTRELREAARQAFARGDFPAGFVWSGGVEEDLDALEDLQDELEEYKCDEDSGADSPIASPVAREAVSPSSARNPRPALLSPLGLRSSRVAALPVEQASPRPNVPRNAPVIPRLTLSTPPAGQRVIPPLHLSVASTGLALSQPAGQQMSQAGNANAEDDSQVTARSDESEEENPNTVAKLFPTRELREAARAAFARGDFQAGFVWSGGVEEDLDALEDLQDELEGYSCDEDSGADTPMTSPAAREAASSSTVEKARPALLSPLGLRSSRVAALPVEQASPRPIVPRNTPVIPRLCLKTPPAGQRPVPPLHLSAPDSGQEPPRAAGQGTSQGPKTAPEEAYAPGARGAVADSAFEGHGHTRQLGTYEEERERRPLYRDPDLHLLMLETVLHLMLTEDGELDPFYFNILPDETGRVNVIHTLTQHLSHDANAGLVGPLHARALAMGPAATRALRLMCRPLFNHDHLYSSRTRMARNPTTEIYACQVAVPGDPVEVVLKVVDLPPTIHDPCTQVGLFSEVAVMERLRECPGVCQLLDYGIDGQSGVMVLKRYTTSLRSWRLCMPQDPTPHLRLYLRIFAQLVGTLKMLADLNIVHYDIKGDNVFLEAAPGATLRDLLDLPSEEPPFRAVFADFGETRMFRSSEDALSSRNRGTECIKSPEMLLVGSAGQVGRATHDRRRREGAGLPSDVWSLGCLFFELLTGDYLFDSRDWVQFFARLTSEDYDLFPPNRLSAITHLPGVVELLQFMLVRDPHRRPPVHEVAKRVEVLLSGTRYDLPAYTPPTPAQCRPPAFDGTRPTPFFGGLPPPLSAEARYALAEHAVHNPTELGPALLLGSADVLTNPAVIQQLGIGSVFLVAGGVEAFPRSSGEALVSWAIDSESAGCLATCAAGEATCSLVSLGPLEGGVAAQKLGELVPDVVHRIRSLTDRSGQKTLIAAAPGYEAEATALSLACLMACEGLSTYQALIRATHLHPVLQIRDQHLRLLRQWEKSVSAGRRGDQPV